MNMSENKKKIKAKIKIKTSQKTGSIAEAITTQQQKGTEPIAESSVDEVRVTSEPEKKETRAETSQVNREQNTPSSATQRTVSDRGTRPAADTRANVPPRGPRTVFVDPSAPVKPTAGAGGTASRGAKKGGKKKSHLREDIIKQKDSERVFFDRTRNTKKKGRNDSGPVSPSIPSKIKITEFVQVGELARKLNIKTPDLIAKLMQMGVMATITQSIDAETATLVASELGAEVEVVSLYDETVIADVTDEVVDLEFRPPVVTIMGHVDHGKTKLLDALRSTDIVATEAGGITQHIGAYQVQHPKGKITFLDTPGHEAFTAMRARGAQITDIVVLVVAADDGVMPQTEEAISHAKDAKVPIIVAINKIDKPDANIEKVKQALMKYELVPEEWGGSTVFVEVSALQKLNLDKLEDAILTQAEIMELKANPNRSGIGTVIEAKLDQGRGPVATILISNGTLKVGDAFLVGLESGKVRAMINDRAQSMKEAGPATPVEILGLSGVPNAGDPFHVMDSEREAKGIMEKRQELARQQQAQKIKKVRLENLNEVIEEGKVQELKVIIKADVRGSVEALQTSLEKLSSGEIRVQVIFGGTGEISDSDINLASAANAMIIAFNTRANNKVRELASREGIEIKSYNIIYQAIDEIKSAIAGMLSPDVSESLTGEIEIRQIFKISQIGTVGGAMVTSGFVKRANQIRLVRDGSIIFRGKLKSLKRFQDDVAEVKEGYECGVLLDGYNDIKPGDIIESFEITETARSYEDLVKKNEAKPAPKVNE